MLRTHVFSFLLVALTAPPATAATPKVVVFGADWCGPCHAVRNFLTKNGVAFEFLTIDEPENREKFTAVTGDKAGIPLTLIDGEKVRGANFADLKLVLDRKGVKLVTMASMETASGEVYGGFPPSWWEMHFRALRQRLADVEKRVRDIDKVGVDDLERSVVLERMKLDVRIVTESLDQLEIDASRAELPRKYRAY